MQCKRQAISLSGQPAPAKGDDKPAPTAVMQEQLAVPICGANLWSLCTHRQVFAHPSSFRPHP
jgi:hypothetical protein